MSNIINRVLKEADYILKTKETIRQTAEKFKVSKSTVHNDINKRLEDININLKLEIDKIFKEHIDNRAKRGGQSTKDKYLRK